MLALGRFTTIDPLAEKYYSISPYAYVANNPLRFIDPTGKSLTDYYNIETGEHLMHVDDDIDEAIAMDRTVYNMLNEEGALSNATAKLCGGISLGTDTNFEIITATLYAEAGYINPNSQESAAIYSVLENRSKTSGKPITDLLKQGIYGYGSTDYNIALSKGKGYAEQDYSSSRHNAARRGAILGMANSMDYSEGAYFWDASVFLDNPTKYSNNYFNKRGHGTTVGTSTNQINFSYTTKVRSTQFMKYNPTSFPNKTWP